jgi:hypothetical protein
MCQIFPGIGLNVVKSCALHHHMTALSIMIGLLGFGGVFSHKRVYVSRKRESGKKKSKKKKQLRTCIHVRKLISSLSCNM